MIPLPGLTLDLLKEEAGRFARLLNNTPIPELYGVTDGKAVGTHVEAAFHTYLAREFDHTAGSAARGIDLPDLGVDLKATSIRQPQSSSPFRDAHQKVYGLGYHLLVFVYDKTDDATLEAARLTFHHVMFIARQLTSDYQTTTGVGRILKNDGNVDDIDAFLEERNLPLDQVGRRALAERIIDDPPAVGCLTISNALQWRLQYGRAIQLATSDPPNGLENLLAEQ
jgi:restriction system protein